MAGQEPFLLEGGMSQPTLGQVAATMGRNVPGVAATPGAPAPHVSVITLVLAAVLILLLLHKAGFRFAVTAGRG